jgi:hypothetical protein
MSELAHGECPDLNGEPPSWGVTGSQRRAPFVGSGDAGRGELLHGEPRRPDLHGKLHRREHRFQISGSCSPLPSIERRKDDIGRATPPAPRGELGRSRTPGRRGGPGGSRGPPSPAAAAARWVCRPPRGGPTDRSRLRSGHRGSLVLAPPLPTLLRPPSSNEDSDGAGTGLITASTTEEARTTATAPAGFWWSGTAAVRCAAVASAPASSGRCVCGSMLWGEELCV